MNDEYPDRCLQKLLAELYLKDHKSYSRSREEAADSHMAGRLLEQRSRMVSQETADYASGLQKEKAVQFHKSRVPGVKMRRAFCFCWKLVTVQTLSKQ